MEIKLSGLKGNTDMLNSLTKRLNSINDSIIRVNEQISNHKSEMDRLSDMRIHKENVLYNVTNYINIMDIIDNLGAQADDICEQLYKKEDSLNSFLEIMLFTLFNTLLTSLAKSLEHTSK